MSATMGLFQGTQEQVRNIRGKRAISVRATEVLLYLVRRQLHAMLIFYEILLLLFELSPVVVLQSICSKNFYNKMIILGLFFVSPFKN